MRDVAETDVVDQPEETRAQRRAANRRRHHERRDGALARRAGLDPAVAQTLEERRKALKGVSGGAYYRVSRAHPIPPENQGRPEFLATFDESDDIDDLKVFFRHLATTSHWGNGRYILEACAKGQHGIVLWTEDVSLGDMPEPARTGGGGTVASQIQEVGQLVSAVKTITGDSGGGAETMARLFTAGVTAGKGTDTTTPMMTLLMPVIGKVVERLLAPPAPPVDPLASTLALMERLKIGLPQATPVQTPAAAIAESMATARSIIDAAQGLAPGGGGDREPRVSGWAAWAQAFTAAAPIIGQAIGQITATVNNVVDARKMEHLARAAGARPAGTSASAAVAPTSTSPLAGFDHVIAEGIHTPEVFEAVIQRLNALGHGGLIPAIRSGQATAELILANGTAEIPELNLPGAPAFIEAFVAYVHNGQAQPAATSDAAPKTRSVHIECTKCHAKGYVDERQPISQTVCTTPVPGTDPARPCGGPVVRIP